MKAPPTWLILEKVDKEICYYVSLHDARCLDVLSFLSILTASVLFFLGGLRLCVGCYFPTQKFCWTPVAFQEAGKSTVHTCDAVEGIMTDD